MKPASHGQSTAASERRTSVGCPEVERLRWLGRLTQAVAQATELHEIYDTALDCLTATTGLERAAILLFPDDADDRSGMRFVASRGLSNAYCEAVEGHSPWSADEVPEPLTVEDVIGHRLGELAAKTPGGTTLAEVFAREHIRGLVFVPVLHAGRLLGKFMLYAAEPIVSGQAEAQMQVVIAQAIASQLGLAVAQHRTQRELRRAKDETDVILAGVADAITVQDATGRLTFVNRAAAALCGFESPEQMLAVPFAEVMARFELLDEDGSPLSLHDMPSQVAQRERSSASGVVGFRAPGEGVIQTSLVSSTPVFDDDGALRFVINIARDVSEGRRAERSAEILAKLGTHLWRSLDERSMLSRAIEASIPVLADGALAVVGDGDGGSWWIVTHRDEARATALRSVLERSWDPSPNWSDSTVVEQVRASLRPLVESSSMLAVPITLGERTVGGLVVFHDVSRRLHRAEDRQLAGQIARRLGLALDNARIHESTRRAETEARRMAERVGRLQRVTAALSEAPSADTVGKTVVKEGAAALGAHRAAVFCVDESGTQLVPTETLGYPPELVQRFERFPIEARLPAADAVRTRQAIWLPNREARLAHYPHLVDVITDSGGLAALPLVVEGNCIGALGFAFPEARAISEEDRELARAIATQCAQALERARLYEEERRARSEAERAHRRAAYLDEASAVLASSLDYEATLRGVAKLAVPTMADWTGVDIADPQGGPAKLVSVHHEDRAKVELALELRRKYPPHPDAPGGIDEVVRTGRSVMIETVTDADLQRLARTAEHLELARALAIKSVIIVPMKARGRTLGAISFVMAESGRKYGPEDLAMAEALGLRAGTAIDNALLFEAQRRARDEAEAAATRTRRLQAFVAELMTTVTPSDAATTTATGARLTFAGCDVASVYLPDSERGLEVGATDAAHERVDPVPAEVLEAAQGGELVVRETTGDVARWIGVPLPIESDPEARGVLALGFREPIEPSAEDGALMLAIGRQAALAIGRARHVEELRHSEERAREAYFAAKDAERRKDEFLAMLGHELRNPLAPIVTALHLLEQRPETAGRRELMIIERQVKHLLRLVDDLLDVSRITRGKLELKRERVDVGDAIGKAIEVVSPLLEQRHHRLSVKVPPQGVWVKGDPVRLAQVITNLLTNAAKYTESGGSIEIEASTIDDEARIEVRDNGLGMDASLLPHVFDLFVQAPQSIDRAGGGLGLGLTIVRRLVELHGGRVEAFSDGRGRGSRFEVRLPSQQPPATSPTQRSGASSLRPAPSPGRRVLVVDDNVDAADMLGMALMARGHDVRLAHDGPGALAIAGSFDPEIALLDIGLPVMDGYELAAALRQRFGRELRLIAITGYGQAADIERALSSGFDAHFVKPVALTGLLAAIDRRPSN